jgi:hypothetical protein
VSRVVLAASRAALAEKVVPAGSDASIVAAVSRAGSVVRRGVAAALQVVVAPDAGVVEWDAAVRQDVVEGVPVSVAPRDAAEPVQAVVVVLPVVVAVAAVADVPVPG